MGRAKAAVCRSRLGAAQKILAGKQGGNGLLLDGSGGRVALFLYGLEDFRRQVKFFEFHLFFTNLSFDIFQ